MNTRYYSQIKSKADIVSKCFSPTCRITSPVPTSKISDSYEWIRTTLDVGLEIHHSKFLDQKIRARKLVDAIQKTGYKHLVYMDGRGIFTALLLCELKSKKLLGKISLIVVDHCRDMNAYHENYFPKFIKCVQGDVFDVLYQHDDAQNTFLYLNFTGIGSSVERTMSHIRYMGSGGDFAMMISVSLRNLDKKVKSMFLDDYNSCDWDIIHVSNRKNFHTIIVSNMEF